MQIRLAGSQLADFMSSARELLNWAAEELNNCTTDPTLDSLLLLSEATGISRTQVALKNEISEEQVLQFRSWIIRRKSGEPIQYIVGRAYFRNLTLQVGPGVLIPRPETESLVDLVHNQIAKLSPPRVLDLGAGSGALALAIASEFPNAQVTALEKEATAFFWLRKNVIALNLEIELIHSDVSTLDRREYFDVVIANPPYIPNSQVLVDEVQKFEPHEALFGGVTGMEIPERFIEAAAGTLKPGGFLAMEHHESHGEELSKILKYSFTNVQLHYDLAGRPRFSTGVRK